jgi:hypothetical protein
MSTNFTGLLYSGSISRRLPIPKRTDFFNAFEKGALIFNYLGHGGEDGYPQSESKI